MKIGAILLKLRRERRFSQIEVAERIGVCQSAYCTWESDRAMPSARYYSSLAALFNVDLAALISGNLVDKVSSRPILLPPTDSSGIGLHEEIIQIQRETIVLQKQRIEHLEAENKHLQQRIMNDSL